MNAIKATLKLPKMKTKTIWAGLYFNHYSQIVFFRKKPKPSKEEHNRIDGEWFDCLDNKDLIIGGCGVEQFLEWFPDADISQYTDARGWAKEIEIPEVFQIKITAPFSISNKAGLSSPYFVAFALLALITILCLIFSPALNAVLFSLAV